MFFSFWLCIVILLFVVFFWCFIHMLLLLFTCYYINIVSCVAMLFFLHYSSYVQSTLLFCSHCYTIIFLLLCYYFFHPASLLFLCCYIIFLLLLCCSSIVALLFSHCPCCFSCITFVVVLALHSLLFFRYCITLFMLCCYFCTVVPLSLVLLINTYEPNSWCSFRVMLLFLHCYCSCFLRCYRTSPPLLAMCRSELQHIAPKVNFFPFFSIFSISCFEFFFHFILCWFFW